MQIMTQLRIMMVQQMVMKESIQFIHKILNTQSPAIIFKLFTQSNGKDENIRGVKKFRVKLSHKLTKVTNSLFYRSLYLFNCLEFDVRNFKVKKLSKYLQENIKYIFPLNKIPKVEYN